MFVKYERLKYQKPTNGKKIRIFRDGQISFYREAVYDSGIFKYGYADLYYDSERKRVGIIPIGVDNSDSVTVRKVGTKGVRISAKRFFGRFGIPIPVGKHEYTVEDGMIVIQLKTNERRCNPP
jgi:hypothetical protein